MLRPLLLVILTHRRERGNVPEFHFMFGFGVARDSVPSRQPPGTSGRLTGNRRRGGTGASLSTAVAGNAFARSRNPSEKAAWTGIWAASLLGIFAMVVGAWLALNPSRDENANTSAAMYTLFDTGNTLEAEVGRIIRPAMERTENIARSSELIRALNSGDSAAQTALLDSQIVAATEIDAIALYSSEGRIIAINTCYANGQPIPAARVNRVLRTDFSQLSVIQSCLRNNSSAPILEFQTHCNITPAFFDSTGLSVACSVPVIDPQNGGKLGVISSRLRFERLSVLIEGRALAGGSVRAYFVTDAGGYFSEAINSGRELPPVPTAELRDIVGPDARDAASKAVIKRQDKYLAVFSLPGFQTSEGGGIHILIVADSRWLTMGPRQDRLVHGAGAGLIGMLLLIVAELFHARLAAGGSRRIIAEANETNTQLAAMVESSAVAIVSEDMDGTIRSWNQGAEKMFGYSAREVIGRASASIEQADRIIEMADLRQKVLGGASVEQFETRRFHKDGRQLDISISLSLIRNQAGEMLGFARIARDITSQKRVELELREALISLETAHTKLVEAARQAGMAEIAIGVLHNVGNVLTSVNVSANVVDEHVRNSRASNLGKVVAMLKEHEGDLAQFLGHENKGREVLAYLEQLSEAIALEQKDMLGELESLSKNVEHVKEIVNAQQSYATAVPLVESLNVRDLLEDALRINLLALGRHQVNVVRKYGDEYFIFGDRHKLLQILINLITNAKQAMSQSEIKTLTLTTDTGPAGEIRVSIHDTGCGIADENLARIFLYGFTTKTGGHGFGLHSSALAAREMNGALIARSDGLGHGATFTLVLPLGRRAGDPGVTHELTGTGRFDESNLLLPI